MLKAFYTRPLVIYLVLALVAISTAAGPAEAMLLPASPEAAQGARAYDRAADLAAVQKTLESKELRQKLRTTDSRLRRPRPASPAFPTTAPRLAANLDSVQAGGDSLGFVLGLVIIALLVVLIIYLSKAGSRSRKNDP